MTQRADMDGTARSASRRVHIPRDVERRVLLLSGYRCSIPHCATHWPALQFHHVDEDPSNSTADNLLLLCASHHQLVTQGHIDRRACELLRRTLGEFEFLGRPSPLQQRGTMLYSLAAELHVATSVLHGPELSPGRDPTSGSMMYPHLPCAVLEAAIAAGGFTEEQDRRLFTLIYDWSQRSQEFNRFLDLTEARLVLIGGQREAQEWHDQIVKGRVLKIVRDTHAALLDHLLANYLGEIGIGEDHRFFEGPDVATHE